MSDVRARVYDCVRSDPGVHFNELERTLGLATGQVQYHLRRLTRAGHVTAQAIGDRTHYFEAGRYDDWERRTLALAHRETARELLVTLSKSGQARATTLADELGVVRSTVAWHVSRLTEAGVVEKSYDDSGRVELALSRPDATRRLLATVEPSVSARLLDRFIRLVDGGVYDRE